MSSAMTVHSSSRDGNVSELASLIALGADINQMDSMRRTALHIACWRGDLVVVKMLLQAKASATILANDGFTALHFACQSSSPDAAEICELLVKSERTLLNAKIKKGNKSPLHLAAAKGNAEVVHKLLKLGGDPAWKVSNGETPADTYRKHLLRKGGEDSLAGNELLALLESTCAERLARVQAQREKARARLEAAAAAKKGGDLTVGAASAGVTSSSSPVPLPSPLRFTIDDIESDNDNDESVAVGKRHHLDTETAEPIRELSGSSSAQLRAAKKPKVVVALSHLGDDEDE